jgi:hypothetical protein
MLLALQHVFQSAPSLSMTVPQLWHIPSFILGVKHARLGHPYRMNADSSTAMLTLPWLA